MIERLYNTACATCALSYGYAEIHTWDGGWCIATNEGSYTPGGFTPLDDIYNMDFPF